HSRLQPRLQRNWRAVQLAESRDRKQASEQIVESCDLINYRAQRHALVFQRLGECILSLEAHRRDRITNFVRDLPGHATKGGGALGAREFFSERTRFVTRHLELGAELIQRVYDAIEFALTCRPYKR